MNNSIQSTIILLIEQIVVALGGEFKLYLPQLIPHMLRVFMHDNSQSRIVSVKVSGKLQQRGWFGYCWCRCMPNVPCSSRASATCVLQANGIGAVQQWLGVKWCRQHFFSKVQDWSNFSLDTDLFKMHLFHDFESHWIIFPSSYWMRSSSLELTWMTTFICYYLPL